MKLRVWTAIARAVILESIRRKDFWVVAILGALIILSAGALGLFGFSGLENFAKDLATTVLGLFSTIIAIVTTTRLMPEEVKNRTLYPLLARPISRFDLLLGKLSGAVAVSWMSFLVLVVLTAGALALFHVQFEAVMFQYVVGKMLGLVVLCSVSLMLSTFMTPSAATTLGFVLALGSGIIIRALVLASTGTSEGMRGVFKCLNWLIPQYGLFDFGSRVANTNWPSVPLWVMGFLLVYALAYSSSMMLLSWARFRSKAI